MKRAAIYWRRSALSAAITCAIAFGGTANSATVQDTYSTSHLFRTADVVGDFDGQTYGTWGNGQDTGIFCGTCTDQIQQAKDGTWLYPIDSEFGFYVIDFAYGIDKVRDDDYLEGWAGNVVDAGSVVGLAVSNQKTDTFKTPARLGTWCAGLGSESIKCDSEHYVVMEQILTCHETVPYVYTTADGDGDFERADPTTGTQAKIKDPFTNDLIVDCATTKISNTVIVDDDEAPMLGNDGLPITTTDVLSVLVPNESTILDDIAVGDDFSITAKDDGKPLYRWGNLIKRPNDIRLYARMPLPALWKNASLWKPGARPRQQNDGFGLKVVKAQLKLNHLITNNPNDQVRPEDMENEGAIGRQPRVVAGADGLESPVNCYEGDGDYIPAGTLMRNDNYPYAGDTGDDPYAWSEDLQEGLTNGWYTTVDRDPFEWAYDTDGDGNSSPAEAESAPLDATPGSVLPPGTTLLSGPRWRLAANKFGQDIPGLEIPIQDCSPPPYQNDNIKYDVGTTTETWLNLLDFAPDDDRGILVNADGSLDSDQVIDVATDYYISPLAYSEGWVDQDKNEGAVVCDGPEDEDPQSAAGECDPVTLVNPALTGVSINGLPLSRDFDLSVYVKGDRKATQLYTAELFLEFEYDDADLVSP